MRVRKLVETSHRERFLVRTRSSSVQRLVDMRQYKIGGWAVLDMDFKQLLAYQGGLLAALIAEEFLELLTERPKLI